MKEQILNVFQDLGFQMVEMEEFGYGFHYEGNNYLYMSNENDESFLSISIPALLHITDENADSVYRLMDKVNATLKYVKANRMGDSVWFFFERELLGDENLKTLISQMIYHLESSANFLYNAIKESESDMNDDEENEESNDDDE